MFLLGRRGRRLGRWRGHAEALERMALESLRAVALGVRARRLSAVPVGTRGVLRGRVVRLRSAGAVQLGLERLVGAR